LSISQIDIFSDVHGFIFPRRESIFKYNSCHFLGSLAVFQSHISTGGKMGEEKFLALGFFGDSGRFFRIGVTPLSRNEFGHSRAFVNQDVGVSSQAD
jgi:hypothetical protein